MATLSCAGAEPGTRARYLILTAKSRMPPPFAAVDIVYGPQEQAGGQTCFWWQLEARSEPQQSTTPLFTLRALTTADPLATSQAPLRFLRYMLQIPETGESFEYRDVHTGKPLMPAWRDFERHFVPHMSASSRRQKGAPETCEYLGHVLTLTYVGSDESWQDWPDAKILNLDRELLVGTGRSFKDKEGHRLPQKPERQNYTYLPFEAADYTTMIEAGINLFTVQPGQEQYIRAEPVFYLRGAGGNPPLRYPADLYRANYIGSVMFMDEPSILMVGDPNIHNILRYFSDAAALIKRRTHSTYHSAGGYGAFALEKSLIERNLNLGDMRLMQVDYPSWETIFETAYYQFAGGAQGVVHEGRYQLEPFNEAVAKWTGTKRKHTPSELLRYHFAFLRGGARRFGKFWGTSIYGQADPAISPLAVKLAYDMGARYVWFWTSDHDHHMPWPEQLQLARALRDHARENPRPSIFGPQQDLDIVILIPNGYFLSLENLWWVRVLDKEGKNEASQRYRRLMQRAFKEAHNCFDRGEDFDIAVDDGRPVAGYKRIVRIDDAE